MRVLTLGLLLLALLGCAGQNSGQQKVDLKVPPGYQATLEVVDQGTLYGFGPFVGYYFKAEPGLRRVKLVCFNERGFYSSDMPVNALLFKGEAVLTRLPRRKNKTQSGSQRITPVFFSEAPREWLATRPEPPEEYLHFHSAYNANGAALIGYWIRHRAVAAFTYDMGGRVDSDSPLYHHVKPGVDAAFAKIIEFDRGPDQARVEK